MSLLNESQNLQRIADAVDGGGAPGARWVTTISSITSATSYENFQSISITSPNTVDYTVNTVTVSGDIAINIAGPNGGLIESIDVAPGPGDELLIVLIYPA